MRKIYASFMLLVFITCVQPRQADAFVLVPMAAAVLGGVILVAGAYTFYKPAALPVDWSTPCKFNGSATDIVRIAYGSTQVMNQYGQNALNAGLVSFHSTVLNLQQKLSVPATAALYPSLKAALYSTTVQPVNVNSKVADIVITGTGSTGKVTSASTVTMGPPYFMHAPGVIVSEASVYIFNSNQVGTTDYSTTQTKIYMDPAVAPPPSPMSGDQLSVRYPARDLPTAALSDLDRMIAENYNGYGVDILDTTHPSDADRPPIPWVAPAVTAPVVNVAAPTATGLGSGTVAATGNALAGAQTALSAATAARDAYIAAHPAATADTDPALKTLQDGVVAAGGAVTSAQTANTAAVQADKEVYQNANVDAAKTLSFEGLKRLAGALGNVFPFVLLGSIVGSLSSLAVSPAAPVFTIPFPLGFQMTVDLSSFNTVAQVCRVMVAALLSFGIVFYIVRFWRGVA